MAAPLVVPSPRDRAVRWAVTLAVLGGVAAFLLSTGPTDGWRWSRVWGDGDRVGWRDAFFSGLWVTLRAMMPMFVIFG